MSRFLMLGAEEPSGVPLNLMDLCSGELAGIIPWYSTPQARMIRRNELARQLKRGTIPAPSDVRQDPTLAPYDTFYDGNILFMTPSPMLSEELGRGARKRRRKALGLLVPGAALFDDDEDMLGKGFFKRVKRSFTPPKTAGGKKKLKKLIKTSAIVAGSAAAAYFGGAAILGKLAAKKGPEWAGAKLIGRAGAKFTGKAVAKKSMFGFLGKLPFAKLGKQLGAAASSVGMGVLTDKLTGKSKKNMDSFMADPGNQDFIRDEGAAYMRDGSSLYKVTAPGGNPQAQQFTEAQVPEDAFESLPQGIPVKVEEDKGDDLAPATIAGSGGLRPGGDSDESSVRGEEIPADRLSVLTEDTAMQEAQAFPEEPAENTTPMEDAMAREAEKGSPALRSLIEEDTPGTTTDDQVLLGALLEHGRRVRRQQDARRKKMTRPVSRNLSDFCSELATFDPYDLEGLAAQASKLPKKVAPKRQPSFFASLFTGIYEGAAGEVKAAAHEYITLPVDKEMALLQGHKDALRSLSFQMAELLDKGVPHLLAMKNASADAFSDNISKASRQAKAQIVAATALLDKAMVEGNASKAGILKGQPASKAMVAFLYKGNQAKSQAAAAKARAEQVRSSYSTFWSKATSASALSPIQYAKGVVGATTGTAKEFVQYGARTFEATGRGIMQATEMASPYMKYLPIAAAGLAGIYVISLLPRRSS